MRPSAWKEDRRLPIYGRLPCRRCRSRMCRVPAIGSLRSFGWCRVDTSVLLVACSLSPWPARRLSPFSFFIFLCRISLPTTSTSPTIWTGCCSAWPSRRLLGSYCGAWAGAVKGVQALRARIRFSRLLRQPSDPRTATVAASKRGGRTLILDTNPGGYQPLSEVRLALWLKAEMLMPGERVTVYGRPGGKNSLLVSSAQRGRAFLGTETSRSTVSPGPLDEKVSGATLVDWAAWAASTTLFIRRSEVWL
jgi:hypothetical protein